MLCAIRNRNPAIASSYCHFLKHAGEEKKNTQAPTDLGGRGLSVIGAQVHLLEHLNLKSRSDECQCENDQGGVREGREKENCEMDGEASNTGENAAGHVTLRQNPVRFERSGSKSHQKETPTKTHPSHIYCRFFEIKTATFKKRMCKLRGNYDHNAE